MVREDLELLAKDLREFLGMDAEVILNSNNFEELSEKIGECKYFKVSVSDKESYVLLENENHFTIYLCGERETKFYELVRLFTYAVLIDKESLTAKELEHKIFYLQGFTNKEAEYLMRAFMMPPKAMVKAMVQFEVAGDGSNIDMIKMQKEVNKYCYKRGKDLFLW